MNEKLIAALRNDAESANADYSTPLTLGNHLNAAADALELAEAKKDGRALVSQWVSVDDRLPLKVRINGEPVYYLCKHASWGCVFVGCFLSKSHGTVWAQQIFREDSNRRFSVSHWMEIPEPPKEEQ